ncbi:hypothetical protein [Gelidibacter maritimus]|uniref:Uncharacterized protein n=1 Tax=Gelidibacter maritimus TaxID=2761487 RepID=A0A7W2R4D4_9FLAO|nr:hypothetical protein [Gelidibacter maritimus]MBA6152965.1 hypothetical protein [Gelidibacter maritimus]
MKTANFIKIGLGVILLAVVSLISLKTFAHKSEPSAVKKNWTNVNGNISLNENTSVTIDSNTSDSEFEDIQALLKEQHIDASFTQIKRNDIGKITGIKIKLTDAQGNQAVSQMSSHTPIPQIVFGVKDGTLYITRSDKEHGAMAFFNRPNMAPFGFDNDSIGALTIPQFGGFNFDDFFNEEDGAFFLNGRTLNLDEFREQMKKQMESSGFFGNNLSQFFDHYGNGNLSSKFNFRDDPNTNKLIIIDGKESDFQTLDHLAKSDQLQTVDHLRSDTAKSIYGEKAKDGAVIATTKSNK